MAAGVVPGRLVCRASYKVLRQNRDIWTYGQKALVLCAFARRQPPRRPDIWILIPGWPVAPPSSPARQSCLSP